MGTGRDGAEVHISTLHLSTHGVAGVKVQENTVGSDRSCITFCLKLPSKVYDIRNNSISELYDD